MPYPLIVLCLLVITSSAIGQENIGGKSADLASVSASDKLKNTHQGNPANSSSIFNDTGYDVKELEASRFLTQATLGFESKHIDHVLIGGIESWIDYQMQLEQTRILPKTQEIFQIKVDSMAVQDTMPGILEFRPRWWVFNYAWWDQMMRNEDLLRHRVAVALTEIFVISRKGDLQNFGDGFAGYYDMLAQHAFGNFRELIEDVSLHPCMGKYLSHLNNPKADLENNIHPDENYAREIMQLFTIGLYELNNDGSRKLDNAGNYIPTYGQDDIREYAKIFTGLGVAKNVKNPYNHKTIYFGKSLWTSDVNVPMVMYEDQHETGPKTLLGNQLIPSDQGGMKDINDALDNLFNHPNVGPFISFRIIQRLVKSNPSPEYVGRVASVFNDNGDGVRGDMAAMINAILLDPEARLIPSASDLSAGRLKEPLLRYTQFARMIDKKNANNFLWNDNAMFAENVKQDLFDSPSVFNFYLPDYSPSGDISEADLFAPEFTIHTTITSPSYVNEVYRWTSTGNIMETREGLWMSKTNVEWDITSLKEVAMDPETFINEMDRMLTHGTLSAHTRGEIHNVLTELIPGDNYDYLEERVRLGTYLFLISPDYAVIR